MLSVLDRFPSGIPQHQKTQVSQRLQSLPWLGQDDPDFAAMCNLLGFYGPVAALTNFDAITGSDDLASKSVLFSEFPTSLRRCDQSDLKDIVDDMFPIDTQCGSRYVSYQPTDEAGGAEIHIRHRHRDSGFGFSRCSERQQFPLCWSEG